MPAKAILTAESVCGQLRKHNGNMAAAARALGVSRGAVWKFAQAHADVKEIAHECREAMKDDVESALYKAAKGGEPWAVCFYLKTQAKDRGYVERQEVRDVSDADVAAAIELELARMADRGPAALPGGAAAAEPIG